MSRYRLFIKESASTPTGPDPFAYRESLTIGAYKPTDLTCGLLNDPQRPMTVINGNVTPAAGEVVRDKIINGWVNINAANVTLDNCWIKGPVTPAAGERGLVNCQYSTCVNAVIRDCLIQPQVPAYVWNGITGHHYTAKRVKVLDTTDGFGVFNVTAGQGAADLKVFLLGSWVSSLAKFYPDGGGHTDGTHNDAIQVQGGANLVMTGCRMEAFLSTTAGSTPSGLHVNTTSTGADQVPVNRFGNACVQLNNAVGELSAMEIDDNWLDGGGITVNGLGINTATNLGNFKRNKFGRNQYFATQRSRADIDPVPTVSFPLSGADANVYEDDGTPVTLSRNPV